MEKATHFILIKTSLLFCFLFVAICCSNGQNNKNVTLKITLPNEDIINIDNTVVLINVANSEFKSCDTSIEIGGKVKLKRVIDSIPSNIIMYFQDTAKHYASLANVTSNFITCLQITLGMDTYYKKMQLLFKPLYATKAKADSVDTHGKTWRFYNVNNIANYYTYNYSQGKFLRTNDTSAIKRYQDTIQIYSLIDHKFEKFNNSQSVTGDVESLIFPFEEIDSLISQNGQTTVVKFINTALAMQLSQNKTYIKHSILLCPKELYPQFKLTGKLVKNHLYFLGGGLQKEYANLAHLCPPNCIKLLYPLK